MMALRPAVVLEFDSLEGFATLNALELADADQHRRASTTWKA